MDEINVPVIPAFVAERTKKHSHGWGAAKTAHSKRSSVPSKNKQSNPFSLAGSVVGEVAAAIVKLNVLPTEVKFANVATPALVVIAEREGSYHAAALSPPGIFVGVNGAAGAAAD